MIFEYAPAPETTKVDIRKQYGLFINGAWTKPAAGAYFDTVNPANEEQLARIGTADAADVDRAVRAAQKAYDRYWRRMAPADRAKYIYRIARAITERSRELAVLETLDGGKPIKESRDLPRLVASMAVSAKSKVTVLRKGKEVDVEVTLGRLEDGEKQMAKVEDQDEDTPKADTSAKALGLTLSTLNDDARKTFKLKDSVKGVLVSGVEQGSPASDKGLRPGDVIEEVNQQAVEKPADVSAAIDALKKQGKKSALLLVGNGAGDVRFVALSLN